MTLSELKRKLQAGTKLTRVYRFGKTDEAKLIVKSVQSNGLYLVTEEQGLDKTGRGSFLEFYPASLTEITDKGFAVFGMGERPLNDEEKKIVDGYEVIRNREQEALDALSDGSGSFWKEKGYYLDHNAEYLFAGYTTGGNRFKIRRNWNSKEQRSVYDPAIKGVKELEYTFE